MVMNHDDSAFNRHPNPAKGCAESVNWNLKGAAFIAVCSGAQACGASTRHLDAEKHQSGKRNPHPLLLPLVFLDKKVIVSLYYWLYHPNPDEMLNGAKILSQHRTHAHCS
jgi:hypothetical protein